MSFEKVVADVLIQAQKKGRMLTITEGVVESVDREGCTCNLSREGLPELLNVRLSSITSPGDNIIVIYPRKGSSAICAMVNNTPTDYAVISVSDVEELSGNIDGMKLSWTKDGITINDGGNGGLTITPELKKQLQRNTARIDMIISILKNQITSVSLQPNPAWAGIVTPLFEALQKEDYSSIENKRVKH
jgi:hypothetical protein